MLLSMVGQSLGFGGAQSAADSQSLEDKLQAFRCFISGQALLCTVLKATTSQLIGPKRKHLNYLITLTNEPNVSIPKMAKYLMLRANHHEWPVVFKALITIHHLMSYGNEKFAQNLASSTVNCRVFNQLSSFDDRSSPLAYAMSVFVRRYSRYINTKIQTYRQLGLDFCQSSESRLGHERKSSSSPIKMRALPLDQLHEAILPPLERQFDSLIEFDVTLKDLSNGIISSAFATLYKDFVLLYIAYQSAIVRLLELYFQVTQLRRAQELLAAYKKFLVRMDKVSDFMRTIDMVGMDKGDLPSVSRAPNVPLKSIEAHVRQLEWEASSRRSVYLSPVAGSGGTRQALASATEPFAPLTAQVVPKLTGDMMASTAPRSGIRRPSTRRQRRPHSAMMGTSSTGSGSAADDGYCLLEEVPVTGAANKGSNDCDRLDGETDGREKRAGSDVVVADDGPDLIVMDPCAGPQGAMLMGIGMEMSSPDVGGRPPGWVEL